MLGSRRIALATLAFGSLWGLLECTVGALLHITHLPAGATMASLALFLMAYSRRLYQKPGMQLSMALLASTFKLLNLGIIGGCVWCAMFAIIAEGLLFELMLFLPQFMKFYERRQVLSGAALGYVCFTGGYFLTEIATPFFSSAGFFLSDLLALTPFILYRGLVAAVISSVLVPLAFRLSVFDISKLKSELYYPLLSALTLVCWLVGAAA